MKKMKEFRMKEMAAENRIGKMTKSLLTAGAVLALSLSCLAGCGQNPGSAGTAAGTQAAVSTETAAGTELSAGGVLFLSVNPEIAITYDENGNVTKVESRNDEGAKILENYTGYEGKATREVVTELVTAIGEAGYFVEEIEGEARQITIEIEAGSTLPNDTFLDEVAADVRNCVNSHDWHSPLDIQGESDYGMTEYDDTDYGPNNDGVTDYDDTDYGPNNDGVTDYDDTDYGPNNDGVTDYSETAATTAATAAATTAAAVYDDTDYGPNNDGVTDYDDTDYGPNNDGVTDYDDTDYGPNNDGVTNYDDTDYGPNNDGVTNYDDTDYGPNNDGVTDYSDSGDSNYDDGGSNYDADGEDGDSGYDD